MQELTVIEPETHQMCTQRHCLDRRDRHRAYEYDDGDDGTRAYDAFSCYDVSLPYYT